MPDRIARVSLFGNVAKAATVNLDATNGAQVGVNLRWSDGTLVTPEDLKAAVPSSTPSDGTTDDIDEGQFNVWFTPRRAQDAVGGIIADSANVTLRYVDGESITADLKDLANSGTGTLQAITRDAKGRVSGARAVTAADIPAGAGMAYNRIDANGDIRVAADGSLRISN